MTNKSILGTNAIHFIILSIIYLLPLIFVDEINKGIGWDVLPQSLDIRSLKEFGMILVIPISVICSIVRGRLNKYYKALPILLFVFLSVIICSIEEPYEILLCGIRWMLPFFLPIFLYGYVDDVFMKKFYNALTVIFVLHVLLQILELFVMPPYNGTTYFGLTARVPGITSHPHASAYFVCSYFLVMLGFEKNKSKKIIIIFFIILSILLSMSSTGVIAITVLLILSANRNSHWKYNLFLMPIFVFFLYTYADVITNRKEGASEESISGRQELYSNILTNTTLISNNFGYATNGAFILSEKRNVKNKEIMFADSFYTSFLGNMGIFYFICFIFFLIWLFLFLFLHNYLYSLLFLIFYSIFAISDILTEVFPGNIILPIVTAYLLRNPDGRSRTS